MKTSFFKFGAYFFVVLTSLTLCSCNANTPPDYQTVEQVFQSNADNIELVASFLSSSGYDDVIIQDSETMLADLESIAISDLNVSTAINQLLAGNRYLQIIKHENTISLLQWRGIRDVGCGIAYSINGIDPPQIDYVTQIIPLNKVNWYYYVSDYNRWRADQGQTGSSLGQ